MDSQEVLLLVPTLVLRCGHFLTSFMKTLRHSNGLMIRESEKRHKPPSKTSKRPGEISKIKTFNPNLRKNKTYYMNFIHKSMKYMPLQLN